MTLADLNNLGTGLFWMVITAIILWAAFGGKK